MHSLTVAKVGAVEHVPADLIGKLQWLCRFGKPRLGVYGAGWHASIEMNTNSTGTAFEVKSEFRHGRPDEAVDVLIERMLAALATIGAATEGR